MERDAFRELALRAAQAELRRAYGETVPVEAIRFHVRLNASYDHSWVCQPEVTLYPDERPLEHAGLDLDAFVRLLWRDGRVPVWIDLAPEADDADRVTLRATCAGRFSADENEIYNHHHVSLVFNSQAVRDLDRA